MGRNHLYLIVFDGQHYYVEAVNIEQAQSRWVYRMNALEGSDWNGTEMAESVTLLPSDYEVIR